MVEKNFLWTSEYGMHARPAGMLVEKASKFNCDITLSCGKGSASAKGLFALMGLGVKQGDKVTVRAEGTGEEEASTEISKFLTENNFVSEI